MQQCFHPSAKHLLYRWPTHWWWNYFQSWGAQVHVKKTRKFL